MADKIKIVYFLEDRAQEGFIKTLVSRIAKEKTFSNESLINDVRSARGGSRVINQFRNFLKDMKKMKASDVDILVVAIDGNCKGPRERIKQLGKYIKTSHPCYGKVVYAVPDPHIELWYIMDQRAFKKGIGLDKAPDVPSKKCIKEFYKKIINQALKESNISSLLGASEYAEKIVDKIESLDSLKTKNSGFETFIEGLRALLKKP